MSGQCITTCKTVNLLSSTVDPQYNDPHYKLEKHPKKSCKSSAHWEIVTSVHQTFQYTEALVCAVQKTITTVVAITQACYIRYNIWLTFLMMAPLTLGKGTGSSSSSSSPKSIQTNNKNDAI